jgi:alkylation response protein AidB-like acyl-CoA dehydrogenase
VIYPEDAGGLGLGHVELAALAEEMGRALVPGAWLATLLAGAAIDAAGSKKHLAEIASGHKKGTFAAARGQRQLGSARRSDARADRRESCSFPTQASPISW